MAVRRTEAHRFLPLVRKGDGQALLCLMDHLEETGEFPQVLRTWREAVDHIRRWDAAVEEGRRRVAPHDMACRWAWNMWATIRRRMRPGWRLARDGHEGWQQWRVKFGWTLLKYARALDAARAPEEPADAQG